ncbi:MAG: hypothetical protein WBB01_18110 [Phormidesmis sp.]
MTVANDLPNDSPDDRYFYSSFVVEYLIPEKREQAFKRWYARLIEVASQQKGYTRTDLCEPLDCGDGVVKYYYIIHFATPEYLNEWLGSDARREILQTGQDCFLSYRYKSFTTGLEGWFLSHSGEPEQGNLGPPAWKQVLSVVLGLYPTLMIQGLIFAALGIMQSWPYPTALAVNNLITSSAMTWLVMPTVTKFLRFWLRPAYRLTTLSNDVRGAALVFGALAFMVSIFNYLYPQVQ